MKKILAVLLTVVLTVGILPVAVFGAASDPIEITPETYAWNDGNGPNTVILGGGRDYNLVPSASDPDAPAVIEEGQTWTVEQGTTLYVFGKLEVKGTLTVKGYVTAIEDGTVTAKSWMSGNTVKTSTIYNAKNICGNESAEVKRYFAEVRVPRLSAYDGFTDGAHTLRVKYLTSRTGSPNDYLCSDLYYESLNSPEVPAAKWSFENLYSSPAYNSTTEMLTVPLNQYLFLHFDFLSGGSVSKKYDGDRLAIRFNGVNALCEQGVCTQQILSAGEIEYCPAAMVNTSGAVYRVWKDSYFLRQERIYLPSGNGFSVYGVNGEASATDQTVRLNYSEEFKFRVKIDSNYSDSAYAVYLVQGYQWDSRNYEDSMDVLVDEVYFDEQGQPQHYVWKFEPEKDGENQKVYIDQYGVYHISSVEDEYTVVVTGVVSNEALSLTANVIDTIRNLLNSIRQFFERVKQMLGL